jgi:hypothetical protein
MRNVNKPPDFQLSLPQATNALAASRYETARRLAAAQLPRLSGSEREAAALVLHDALAHLGDLAGALAIGCELGSGFPACLRRSQDRYRSAAHAFYRSSTQARRGLTYGEYLAELEPGRAATATALVAATDTAKQAAEAITTLRGMVADHERRSQAECEALAVLEARWPEPAPPPRPAPVAIAVRGRLRFADGRVRSGTVTLGVQAVMPADPLPLGGITVPAPTQAPITVLSVCTRAPPTPASTNCASCTSRSMPPCLGPV